MDTKTADTKNPPTAVKPRVRIITASKNPTEPASPAEHAAAESLDTVGNHFLQTLAQIRQKNQEVAAARAGNVLTRAIANNKALGLLPGAR